MYTDGSKTKQGAGSGYVILSGIDRVLNTQSINLTGEASIFQAELIAIQEAAKHLYAHKKTQGLYIKLFLDSQAALQALKSNNGTLSLTLQFNLLPSNIWGFFCLGWLEQKQIRAYIGLDGNELVYEYAKLGSVDETIKQHIKKSRQLPGSMSTTNGKKNGNP